MGGWLARHSTVEEMGPPHRLGSVSMGKAQRAARGGGLAEVAVSSDLSPSGVEEADSGKICERTAVRIEQPASWLSPWRGAVG